jgi:hypothetical protein
MIIASSTESPCGHFATITAAVCMCARACVAASPSLLFTSSASEHRHDTHISQIAAAFPCPKTAFISLPLALLFSR